MRGGGVTIRNWNPATGGPYGGSTGGSGTNTLQLNFCVMTNSSSNIVMNGDHNVATVTGNAVFNYPNWQAQYGTNRTDAYQNTKRYLAQTDL